MSDALQDDWRIGAIVARVIAVITARGGSKGLPGKNIREFLGRPLISFAIEAALSAKTVDQVVVSTDDPQIAEISRKYGADVPFVRPSHLATDAATDQPVLQHCIKELIREKAAYDDLLLAFLRPTCVVRNGPLIDASVRMLLSRPECTSVRTISESRYPPFWMKMIDEETRTLINFDESDLALCRRQLLPRVFQANGAVDVIRGQTVMNSESVYGASVGYLKTIKSCSVDIDDELDFVIAEAVFRHAMQDYGNSLEANYLEDS